ncbi:hypothetical protein V866_005208 [Kwoniella sp. B9012]|uniref:FAS1 domain-containing protein n=1 Tax=Kwoniella europaea PYCC6329 TaxID=1423913 RepID=A0AAX4KKV7_9TREE
MKFQIPLLASVALIAGVQAAPVPGLLGNIINPLQQQRPSATPTSNAVPSQPTATSGGLLESNTGSSLSSILKSLKITTPEGLDTTLNGIKLTGLDDLQLSQFLQFILLGPGVHIPSGQDINDIVNQIVLDLDNEITTGNENGNGKGGILGNIFNSGAAPGAQVSHHALQDIDAIFTDGAFERFQSTYKATPTSKSGNLPAIDLGPLANIKPSATIGLLPSGSNKGALGLANVDVSADVNVEGAKITLGPKIHL